MLMKRSYLLVLVLLYCFNISAQTPTFEWVKNIPFIIYSHDTDSDGNIYLIGFFSDTLFLENEVIICNGVNDIILTKYDAEGNFSWYRHFGGIEDDFGMILKVGLNDDLIISCTFSPPLIIDGDTVETPSIDHNTLIAQLTSDGEMISADVPVYNNQGCLHSEVMAIDDNDNIILTGSYYGGSAIFSDTVVYSSFDEYVFLAKFDQYCNFSWVTTWDIPIKQLAIDKSGDILFIKEKDTSINNISELVKISANGEILWKKTINKSFTTAAYACPKIDTDSLNNIYITNFLWDTLLLENTSFTSTSMSDVLLLKLDPNANLLWGTVFGGTDNDAPNSLHIHNDKILISGIFKQNFYLGSDSLIVENNHYNGFFAQLDLNGNPAYIKGISGNHNSNPEYISSNVTLLKYHPEY